MSGLGTAIVALLIAASCVAMVQISMGRCHDQGGVLVRSAWFGLECVQPARKG